MKKQYMIPKLEVVKIGVQPLLAGSPTIGLVDDGTLIPPGGSDAPSLVIPEELLEIQLLEFFE
jgi:hypothetical protein